ncbi:hypothetical protein NLG97_g4314 [Lecanicillium saksenae]|uniref:Uncharacterized protein n=1 Tax=Lecanicillium saksenae TaxID=468837 RepID=A0ACC1QYU0_9HYPO|nr:hypothetical protein NLG97_g4314 [Lecanicillium saksenae]
MAPKSKLQDVVTASRAAEDGVASDTTPRNSSISEKAGTRRDQQDMMRMGKSQQFQRNFGFVSMLGFTCVLMSTWEGQLTTSTFGAVNGGTGGLIYCYLGTFAGFLAVIASMAEMASMAPTAGGDSTSYTATYWFYG